MAVIFGPDAFTVSSNTNIDQYPSVGAPDWAYVAGSGSNISVNATNDRVENNVANTDVIARLINTSVPSQLANQEIRGDLFTQAAGGANSSLGVRYASTRRGYIGSLVLQSANEVQIYEDNSGFSLLASADRSLTTGNTYPASFRAVGSGTAAVFLTLIINSTLAVTFTDTTSVVSGGSPALATFGTLATDICAVDNYVVDDIREYAQVAGIATTNGGTAGTSVTVNMPSGIQAGDTLIAIIRNAAGGTITWPSEGTAWVQLFEDSSDASDDSTSAAWRKADGTEGATITVTFGTSGKFAAQVFRITQAADPTVRAPEFATLVTGTSTTPDPGTVTPTGGSKPYLFIWVGAWEGEQTSPPASAPTNYNVTTGADSGIAGAVTTNCRIATAYREATASSENPGSWTISVSDDWTATVIAVHPSQLDPSAYGRPDGQVGQSQMKQLLAQ